MKFNGLIINCHCLIKHGKIIDRALLFAMIVGKCHIIRRQRLPVRECHVVTDGHRPCKAIRTGLIVCGQILFNLQILCRCSERALDQWFMNVLPCPPAVGRIKARFWLGRGRHRHYDLIRCPLFCPICRCASFSAAFIAARK